MFNSVFIVRQLFLVFGMLAMVACGGGGGGGAVDPGGTAKSSFAVNITVTGLTGEIKLKNNGADELIISANTPPSPINTSFKTKLADKADYLVTISAQPAGQRCAIVDDLANNGKIPAADVTVKVNCTTVDVTLYAVKVAVLGLKAGSTLTLLNNGADSLTITSDTPLPTNIAFATKLKDQALYSVTVDTDPAGQVCTVSAPQGNKIPAADVTVNVTCKDVAAPTYAVNVAVTGLRSNAVLRLLLNNTTLLEFTNNNTKAFSTRLPDKATYAVTIDSKPIGQNCTVVAKSTTISAANVTVKINCTEIDYTIGGTADNTVVGTLKLVLNKGTPTESILTVTPGSFTFGAQPLNFGAGYDVTVDTQPAGLTCSVSKGFGLITTPANVTDLAVTCNAIVYTIGGSISGLVGTVTLLNNGSNPLTVTSAGASTPFTFSAPVGQGNNYLVSVSKQPATQTCVLTDNGVGGTTATPANANVANVVITCSATYSIKVDVRNLIAGGSVSFLNNGVEPLDNILLDGIYPLSIGLVNTNPYAVTISSQPVGQVCSVAPNSVGTINNADVIVIVTCAADSDNDGVLDVNDFFPADPAKAAKTTLDLSTLTGSNGFVINGIDANDFSGLSVSHVDINSDGMQDIIIGASGAKGTGRISGTANQVIGVGETYVIFGTTTTFVWPASFNLSTLDGTNGFIIGGMDATDNSGVSVHSLGDVNGDSYADLVIGADKADLTSDSTENIGEAYVIFGRASGVAWSKNIDLKTMTAADGFRIHGVSKFDQTGYSVSDAGDINSDGISDLVIGALGANSGVTNSVLSAGQTYVLFGRAAATAPATAWPVDYNLSTMVAGEGFVINGIAEDDLSGWSVSAGGDVNGDTFDDLIIGAPGLGVTSAGETYVIFGTANTVAWPATFNLSSLNGSNGFVIKGITAGDNSGSSVSSAGDINNDGIADIIIGAHRVNSRIGESYVLFGRNSKAAIPDLWPATVTLASLAAATADGSTGFIVKGIDANDQTGSAVSSAGDVNGDGFDDIIIGATHAEAGFFADAGESYVIFGRDVGIAWTPVFNLISLSAITANGSTGFVVNGISSFDNSGVAVSSAGDVNGDGIVDMIIGAANADPNGINLAGETYIVFGCNYTSLLTAQICVK